MHQVTNGNSSLHLLLSKEACEPLRRAIAEQHHVVDLWSTTLHTRRTDRHAGNGKTTPGGLLGKKAMDRACRHMALDRVARDLGRVTGRKIGRHVALSLDGLNIWRHDDRSGETVAPQMLDPGATTAAIGVPPYGDGFWDLRPTWRSRGEQRTHSHEANKMAPLG